MYKSDNWSVLHFEAYKHSARCDDSLSVQMMTVVYFLLWMNQHSLAEWPPSFRFFFFFFCLHWCTIAVHYSEHVLDTLYLTTGAWAIVEICQHDAMYYINRKHNFNIADSIKVVVQYKHGKQTSDYILYIKPSDYWQFKWLTLFAFTIICSHSNSRIVVKQDVKYWIL